jgi:hypothetical protein
MEHSGPNVAVMAALLIVGVGALTHFATANIPTIDIVGISGGGAACGAALFGLIYKMATRKKRLQAQI